MSEATDKGRGKLSPKVPDTLPKQVEHRLPRASVVSVLLAFGGYLSLAYLLGYAYWWAYLDVFGATFLLGQVPPSAALFSSANVVLLCAILFAFIIDHIKVNEHKGDTTEKSLLRLVYLLSVIVFILVVLDLFIGDRLLDHVREGVFGAIWFFAVMAAAACGKLASEAWRRNEGHSMLMRIGLGVFFAVVVLPLASGFSAGFNRSSPGVNKPPFVRATGPTRTLYLLFVTDDMVYCISDPEKGERLVFAVPWNSVLEIEGVRQAQARKFAVHRRRAP
ncbi:MAG: hypothetical protein JWM27_2270 [Gemmatimonadetes bacterium]|nr:hypothetical protein [Gemmatimonadota bacterium]